MTAVDAPTHTLGPVASKSVEAIRAQPDSQRRYIRAVIAVEGEAYAALRAYDQGWIGAEDLAGRLRDILAICEAVDAPLPAADPPPAHAGYSIGTRHHPVPDDRIGDAP